MRLSASVINVSSWWSGLSSTSNIRRLGIRSSVAPLAQVLGGGRTTPLVAAAFGLGQEKDVHAISADLRGGSMPVYRRFKAETLGRLFVLPIAGTRGFSVLLIADLAHCAQVGGPIGFDGGSGLADPLL